MNIFLAVGFVALLLALFALLFLLVGHNAAELEKLKKAHFELAKKHNGLLENHTELVSSVRRYAETLNVKTDAILAAANILKNKREGPRRGPLNS
jgi:hypothetical protein